MDALGERLRRDAELARRKRAKADDLESEAKHLRREADEIERLMHLARLEINEG